MIDRKNRYGRTAARIHDADGLARVHGMDEATLAQIAGGNAARVLGLDV